MSASIEALQAELVDLEVKHQQLKDKASDSARSDLERRLTDATFEENMWRQR